MVLHKGGDFRWPLALIVHGAVDLHVLVEDGQELLLALQKEKEEEEEMMTDPPLTLRKQSWQVRHSALGSEDRVSFWGDY